MNQPPTLLVFTPGFAADETDTTCTPAIQQWILEVESQGWEVVILAFQYPYTPKDYLWKGIQVHAAGGNNRSFPQKMGTWWRIWKAAKQYLGREKLVIQSFWLSETALVAELFSSYYKLPHIMSLQGQDAKKENKYPRFFRKKTPIIALSESSAAEFSQNHGLKVSAIIPFGLADNFTYKSIQRSIDILGVGSFIPLKNYSDFIETVATLRQEFPHIQAALIGEGTERQALQAQIERLNLRQNISLLGQIPHSEVFEKMLQSKTFLHPSLYESQGMVQSEALRAGCYLVSSGKGFLPHHPKVLISSPQKYAAHIREILLLNHADYAPTHVDSMQSCVEKYLQFYEK